MLALIPFLAMRIIRLPEQSQHRWTYGTHAEQ